MAVIDEEVLECWKKFFDHGTNWKDFPNVTSYEEYQKITDKQHLSKAKNMPIKYHKVRRLLNKMCKFEDYNENKLKDIDNELQNSILEQDKQTQFGRGLLLYLKEIEIAWGSVAG